MESSNVQSTLSGFGIENGSFLITNELVEEENVPPENFRLNAISNTPATSTVSTTLVGSNGLVLMSSSLAEVTALAWLVPKPPLLVPLLGRLPVR